MQIARGGAPVAFLVAGLVALLTARSYALLSASYPSRGGTVTFINRAFGSGLFSGGINVLLWLSYIVMLALYSQAFGSYAASFLPAAQHALGSTCSSPLPSCSSPSSTSPGHPLSRGQSATWSPIKLDDPAAVRRGRDVRRARPPRWHPGQWSPPLSLVAGGMIVFLAYEGFELIANAAEDVDNPARTLTRAYYISVLFVIVLYVLVAVVAVGSVPVSQLVDAKDYALAVAARPALGSAGFILIAIAAMLSTASAINATLYGSARMSYTIAKARELPAQLERPIWNQPLEGPHHHRGGNARTSEPPGPESISTMGSAGSSSSLR